MAVDFVKTISRDSFYSDGSADRTLEELAARLHRIESQGGLHTELLNIVLLMRDAGDQRAAGIGDIRAINTVRGDVGARLLI